MSVAENVLRLRRAKGLTQLELSERVGVARSMIAQIERGTRVPTILLGRDIANVLGCSIEALISDPEKED